MPCHVRVRIVTFVDLALPSSRCECSCKENMLHTRKKLHVSPWYYLMSQVNWD